MSSWSGLIILLKIIRMKSTELRIGNYVNVPNNKQFPFRIDAFEYCSEKFIKVAQEVRINGTEVHPLTWYGKDLEPIPLTEEWLLKFGFKKLGGYYMLNEFTFNEGTFLWNNFCISTSIQHVHSLQNLYFALTGDELTTHHE